MALLNKMQLPTRPARAGAVRVMASSRKVEKVAIASSVVLSAAPAFAADEPVDSAVDTVINAVKATGEIVKSSISAVESGVKVLKEGYDVAAPVVQKAYNAAAPVVEQTVKVVSDAAAPVVKSALPALESTVGEAGKALEGSGVTSKSVEQAVSVVAKTTTEAATAATPFVTKFFQFLASSDPVTLGEYALGAVALTYLAPALFGGLGGSFRGYAGDLAAAAALDLLVNDGGALLVDVRTAKEKEGSGIPDLPSSASSRVVEVEFAVTEDKKLRSQLRDPSGIEAQVTALQIASLKKISKGSKLVIMDRFGPAARTVAKELNRKGYSKVYVLAGGFDGRQGWVQSKLQIKPAASLTAVSAPSIAKTVFTRGPKSLPAPKSS
mmetsp:Transcript_7847/g.19568  ORF Transcript_7847/g.19568 Transcript_7847/m.19568 type:complete len:381 (-) Transcript_7847:883-2025(-)|eukprot:CAMPEP_0202860970 /NCGR_PEP_ID=MMETSP1391-20130828/2516_1 /ASSEMBLY_ACC=CAM_ASM_000867 /TAXON_ID=1034604 /ORGANISM="Chlamydomonas leiostraca, Strain SAG 11-49" /LENGTH=380 /DNA_ID=CAMNT_0049540265 /DNA_START=56 /DNA_END=1198 /DNA_ORIENTATION=+